VHRYPLNARELTETDFSPTDIFKTLYRPSCLYSWRRVFDSEPFAETMCEIVESQFHVLANAMAHADVLDIHRATMANGQGWWSKLRSNTTCLLCLRCKPEHVLPCGHSMCDKCVQLWGKGQLGPGCYYRVDKCLMCQVTCTKFIRLKPPTAGIRILSLDGGGIRGMVILENMESIQTLLGPDLRLQDLFDLVLGTSAGLLPLYSLLTRTDLARWHHWAKLGR
jgi:hypothetical protein